ncbi:MAG: hypothetical protein KJ051_07390 [Thermoleophilia bacterium]|nr:hypothetical protein [Thermoleophilia bacterium]
MTSPRPSGKPDRSCAPRSCTSSARREISCAWPPKALLIELYRAGKLRLDPLITECALDDVNEAFRRMEAGESARSVIVYPGA